jgi:hypothetical protein
MDERLTSRDGTKQDDLFRRGDAEKNAEKRKRVKAKAESAEAAENREKARAEVRWRQRCLQDHACSRRFRWRITSKASAT